MGVNLQSIDGPSADLIDLLVGWQLETLIDAIVASCADEWNVDDFFSFAFAGDSSINVSLSIREVNKTINAPFQLRVNRSSN